MCVPSQLCLHHDHVGSRRSLHALCLVSHTWTSITHTDKDATSMLDDKSRRRLRQIMSSNLNTFSCVVAGKPLIQCLIRSRFGSSPVGPWSKGGHLIMVTRSSTSIDWEAKIHPELSFCPSLLFTVLRTCPPNTNKVADDHHHLCHDAHHPIPRQPALTCAREFKLQMMGWGMFKSLKEKETGWLGVG